MHAEQPLQLYQTAVRQRAQYCGSKQVLRGRMLLVEPFKFTPVPPIVSNNLTAGSCSQLQQVEPRPQGMIVITD